VYRDPEEESFSGAEARGVPKPDRSRMQHWDPEEKNVIINNFRGKAAGLKTEEKDCRATVKREIFTELSE